MSDNFQAPALAELAERWVRRTYRDIIQSEIRRVITIYPRYRQMSPVEVDTVVAAFPVEREVITW